jgi:GH25 family lysozyme M1 (1,4-beta-N-acetylmuramidase)
MTKSYAEALAPQLKDRYSLWIAATSDTRGQPDVSLWGSWYVHQYNQFGSVAGISGNADLNVLRGPIVDRLIQSASLASRGKLQARDGSIMVEVTGGDSQVVTVQGTTSLTSTWDDILTIQLVNGFGEATTTIDTTHYFLRLKP